MLHGLLWAQEAIGHTGCVIWYVSYDLPHVTVACHPVTTPPYDGFVVPSGVCVVVVGTNIGAFVS